MHAPVASRTPFSLLRQTATGPGDAMRQMPDPKNECNHMQSNQNKGKLYKKLSESFLMNFGLLQQREKGLK